MIQKDFLFNKVEVKHITKYDIWQDRENKKP